MQHPGQTTPSPSSQSFAGLLASLASPEPNAKVGDPASSSASLPGSGSGDLGEDVVTLSYERALRNHARYKPDDPDDWMLPKAASSEPDNARETLPLAATTGAFAASATANSVDDHDLKTTSVTIRMSRAESARLHQRAAEAGVTVSAYLRSCTFEADALRAQVKAALAELRSAANSEPANLEAARPSWAHKLLHAWPRVR